MMSLRNSAHRQLVRHLLAHPDVKSLSVDGGGDYADLSESRDQVKVVEAIEAVEEATLIVHRRCPELGETVYRDIHGKPEWARILPYAVDPDETVVDLSCGGIVDAWFEAGLR